MCRAGNGSVIGREWRIGPWYLARYHKHEWHPGRTGSRRCAVSRQASAFESSRRWCSASALVLSIGYKFDRQRGSHRIYRAPGLPMINLQEAQSGKAKPYQVRQVLAIVDEHGIEA